MFAFCKLAMVAPQRQRAFRATALTHVLALSILLMVTALTRRGINALVLGNVLLVAGIVEGALLIGWRLTQLPKSQALEFLLVSPFRPARVACAEALVG